MNIKARSNLPWWKVSLPMEGGGDKVSFKVAPKPQTFLVTVLPVESSGVLWAWGENRGTPEP